MIRCFAALLLATAGSAVAQAKPTVIVLPPSVKSSDSVVARRAEAFVEALRRELAADTSILWMPVNSRERPLDRSGAPLGARYAVQTVADAGERRRVRLDVLAADVETSAVPFRQTLTVGRDVRDGAAAVALRVSSSIRARRLPARGR